MVACFAGLLCNAQVQCVMGARVPVLKYKCALSGLDCDISIQGSGALVKANFMRLINQHCRTLSPLYRCGCALRVSCMVL